MNKSLYKLKLILSGFLLRAGVRFNSAQLGLWGLALVTDDINAGAATRVLCLGRSIFLDDVVAMAKCSGLIHYQIIRLSYLQIIFDQCRANDDWAALTELNYHTTNIGQLTKERYYRYLEKIMPSLQKRLGFQAVISGNFGYVVQQELTKLCRVLRIPVVILDKEGITLANDLEVDMSIIAKKRFLADKILFYNQLVRREMLKLTSIGLSADQTAVVGIPRLDYYFQNQGGESKNQVVFFAFQTAYRFGLLIKNPTVLDQVVQRSENFYKMVMELALKHPEIKVIIKTKSAQFYSDYVLGILNKNFNRPIPNLEIIAHGNVVDLILGSRAVISYNSTTLLEALAAGRIIITPYFGDLITDQKWDYFQNYPELVNYTRNLEELEDYIFNSTKYLNYSEATRNKYLSQFSDPPLGQASRRAEEEIIKTIKTK